MVRSFENWVEGVKKWWPGANVR